MSNQSLPTTITIDGTTYQVGADLKLLPVRGGISMTRRRALTGPSGGSSELIEFSDGSWRLIDSRGATRSRGPRPGVVDRPRAATGGRRVSQTLLDAWLAGAQELLSREHNAAYPTLTPGLLHFAPRGRRYAKVVEGEDGRGQRVWAFIDLTNGDVLKPHGWNAPAEGARGNLFDRWHGLRFLRWTGPMYLEEVNALIAAGDQDAARLAAERDAVANAGPQARLIAAPEQREQERAYRVYQEIGGAADGQLHSFPLDEQGELAQGDERNEIERRVAAGSLREIGIRRETERTLVEGRWICSCGRISRFAKRAGTLVCDDCGAHHEVAALGPNEFTTCTYCQGALPPDADRHWHAACAQAKREERLARTKSATGKTKKPDYWIWGKPRE